VPAHTPKVCHETFRRAQADSYVCNNACERVPGKAWVSGGPECYALGASECNGRHEGPATFESAKECRRETESCAYFVKTQKPDGCWSYRWEVRQQSSCRTITENITGQVRVACELVDGNEVPEQPGQDGVQFNNNCGCTHRDANGDCDQCQGSCGIVHVDSRPFTDALGRNFPGCTRITESQDGACTLVVPQGGPSTPEPPPVPDGSDRGDAPQGAAAGTLGVR